jgi:hypothetical protein|tara:strand:+ start:3889 stop:4197 length:309 start_codon:yes stop_codon:yes gene_type:complete
MIIYVDIDETICITPPDRDYARASPIQENIEKINKLYEEGNTIVYWTARGSGSGLNWYDVTKDQLDRWSVKHNDLKMGKPTYDLFICDKAVNSRNFFEEGIK